jgi:hypothetical protein
MCTGKAAVLLEVLDSVSSHEMPDNSVESPTSSSPEAMDAALALTGFAASASSLPATPQPAANTLTRLPETIEGVWPYIDGKGAFSKGRDGKDLPFLERLFLMLSLPNLSLPSASHPGRRMGEALRWKTAEDLAALGLPTTLAAFEIGDVALLEAAVYPQYASGSFNKTATKWGIISPVAGGVAGGLVASKRLSRDCMILPPPSALAASAMRPLPTHTMLDGLYEYVASVILPLVQTSRSGKQAVASKPASPTNVSPPPSAVATTPLADGPSVAQGPPLSDATVSPIVAAAADAPVETPPPSLAVFAPLQPAKPSAASIAQPTPAAAPVARGAKRGRQGAQWGELRVALWDTVKKQRIASTSYKGGLVSYLQQNPHLEVYNRQDAGARQGASVLAGVKLSTETPLMGGEPRVVVWDSRAQSKLPIEESPTQSALCAFLRANAHTEVYNGQLGPAQMAALSNAPQQIGGAAAPHVPPPLKAARRPKGVASFENAKPLLPLISQQPKAVVNGGAGVAQRESATAAASLECPYESPMTACRKWAVEVIV